MEDIADTTGFLDETTSMLMCEEKQLTPQKGVEIIDKWIIPLDQAENTRPIADGLKKLKSLLGQEPVDGGAVISQMGTLAGQLIVIAPDMGAEGEMPSLLMALASALRMAGDIPKSE
ncbi:MULTISPECIES: hypothetical protein [Dyadobacter]|uniref:Uncharacterized protein n=1 Tax=Dyadobacter sediminis TaxID=1493691 RepID=A0A5R9K538_9BACT|nr:hypothetical protein [Dyadobacter sediminis]TLU88709.1 hypothetical protein FEM55_24705 [Dyadobacter sediminis]GGC14076.1 hypothetical protein GCM10011325_46250 [Dyadobacter sediminis]